MMNPPSQPSPNSHPPSEGRWLSWLTAVKGLTLANVLVIALLAVIAVPVYIVYRALEDEKLMDRFMSTYEELGNQQSGCAVRHVQERGGPELWGISAGFAFQGADRWFVNVVLTHDPSGEEIVSYCETLKLIADSMLDRGDNSTGLKPGGRGQIYSRPVPSPETNGGGHNGHLSPGEEEAE